jgi:hypothetical protein
LATPLPVPLRSSTSRLSVSPRRRLRRRWRPR